MAFQVDPTSNVGPQLLLDFVNNSATQGSYSLTFQVHRGTLLEKSETFTITIIDCTLGDFVAPASQPVVDWPPTVGSIFSLAGPSLIADPTNMRYQI